MVSLSVFLVHLYPIKIDKPVSTLITDSGKGIDRSSEIFAKNRPKVRSLSPFVRMRYVHTSLADSQCCPHFALSTLDHALLYPIRSRSLSLSSLSSILSFSVFLWRDNFVRPFEKCGSIVISEKNTSWIASENVGRSLKFSETIRTRCHYAYVRATATRHDTLRVWNTLVDRM